MKMDMPVIQEQSRNILKSEEKNKIKKIIQSLQGSGVDLAFKDSNKIFNDKKVIAHSAIGANR